MFFDNLKECIEKVNTLDNEFDSSNHEWRQYILDYRTDIINNSMLYEIDINDMNTYKYRLRDYLEKLKLNKSLDWIVLYINQLFVTERFVNLESILIPNSGFITQLKSQFITNKVNEQNKKIKI